MIDKMESLEGKTNKQRHWQLDFLKGISCIIVVFLHVQLPGLIGEAVIYALRFPVPIFFMITGYFLYGRDCNVIKRRTIKSLKLIVGMEVVYGIWSIVKTVFVQEKSIGFLISDNGAFEHPIRTLLCGSFFNGTLWYLYAAFWTYVIIYLLKKCGWIEKSVVITPVLIGVLVIGRFYVQNNCDIDSSVYLFRNAVTFGFPLTMTGYYIASKKEQIAQKLSAAKSLLIIVAGVLVMVAEYVIFTQYMDFHFSTWIISIGLFLFAETYKGHEYKLFKCVSYIGQRLSMNIYFSHMLFSGILAVIYSMMGFEKVWAHSILVVCVSILWAYLVDKARIKHMVSKRKRFGE